MIHHIEDLQIIIIDNTLEMNSTGNRDSLDLLLSVFSFVFGNISFSLKKTFSISEIIEIKKVLEK